MAARAILPLVDHPVAVGADAGVKVISTRRVADLQETCARGRIGAEKNLSATHHIDSGVQPLIRYEGNPGAILVYHRHLIRAARCSGQRSHQTAAKPIAIDLQIAFRVGEALVGSKYQRRTVAAQIGGIVDHAQGGPGNLPKAGRRCGEIGQIYIQIAFRIWHRRGGVRVQCVVRNEGNPAPVIADRGIQIRSLGGIGDLAQGNAVQVRQIGQEYLEVTVRIVETAAQIMAIRKEYQMAAIRTDIWGQIESAQNRACRTGDLPERSGNRAIGIEMQFGPKKLDIAIRVLAAAFQITRRPEENDVAIPGAAGVSAVKDALPGVDERLGDCRRAADAPLLGAERGRGERAGQ